LELAQHTVADDFEVKLTHAGDDRLASVFVGEYTERRIFFRETLKRCSHFLLIELGLRLNRHGDNRIREGRRLEEDRVSFVTESVSRGDILDADDGRNVTRVTRIDIFALVRLNLNEAGNTLALVRAGIVNRITLGQL